VVSRRSKNEIYNLELFGRSHKSGEEQKLLKTYTHRWEASCKGCMAISSFGEQKQETASYRF